MTVVSCNLSITKMLLNNRLRLQQKNKLMT